MSLTRSAAGLAILLGMTFCGYAADVQVFAAASLTDALKKLAPGYEASTGDTLRFNFAGSNVLSRQIQEGAPADVFLSADEAKMNVLEKAGLLQDGSRRVLLSNTLAVVVPVDSPLGIATAAGLAEAGVKRLALADPQSVPAGIYAKAYLEKQGVWPAVEARVVPTENVRAALAAVASGNAEAGIVYKTDASVSPDVKVAYEVPAAEGPAISYPAAILKNSRQPAEAARFLEYLQSEPAKAIFAAEGFRIAP